MNEVVEVLIYVESTVFRGIIQNIDENLVTIKEIKTLNVMYPNWVDTRAVFTGLVITIKRSSIRAVGVAGSLRKP